MTKRSIPKELCDLPKKINHQPQPVFINRDTLEDLVVLKAKPSLVNQQCVV